jgi:hypothetical protein
MANIDDFRDFDELKRVELFDQDKCDTLDEMAAAAANSSVA